MHIEVFVAEHLFPNRVGASSRATLTGKCFYFFDPLSKARKETTFQKRCNTGFLVRLVQQTDRMLSAPTFFKKVIL